MTTAYTSLLGLALPVTGELSGTWGDTVNTAITSLLDSAVAGTTSITVDADITLTTTTGASNQARQAIILWNPASGTVTRNITAPAQSKLYTVINASGGTQSIVIRGAGPTTGVTIAKGESAMVAWNGSDFVKVSSSGGALTLTDLTVTGNTILGDAAADTLTVNATSTFASPVNFQGQVRLPSTGRSAAAALTPTNPAFLYGVASTYTDTTSSGTLAPVASFYGLAQPTLSTSNVTTYTTAATLYIANAPAAGGSATITNPYALYVAAGANYFAGNAIFASNVTLGDASADTLTVNSTVTSNLLFTDNTYDIGAAAATRPRSIFLSSSATVDSQVAFGRPGVVRGYAGFYPSTGFAWWYIRNDNAGGLEFSTGASVGTDVALTLGAVGATSTFRSNIYFSPDNTYDIGASGATRPRNVFAGSGVVAPSGYFQNGTRVLNSFDTGNTSGFWWELGVWAPSNFSNEIEITIYGTQGFSAGQAISGKTIIILRVDNAGAWNGFWRSEGIQGSNGAIAVAIDPPTGKVYARLGSYFQKQLNAIAANTDAWTTTWVFTNSTSTPSGASLITPIYQFSDGLITVDPSNQSVSIGTTSINAARKLYVYGGDILVERPGVNTAIGVYSAGGSGRPYYMVSDTAGSWALYDNTANANRITVGSNGYVAIGPGSIDAQLNLRGTSAFRITNTTNSKYVDLYMDTGTGFAGYSTGGAYGHRFYTNNQLRMNVSEQNGTVSDVYLYGTNSNSRLWVQSSTDGYGSAVVLASNNQAGGANAYVSSFVEPANYEHWYIGGAGNTGQLRINTNGGTNAIAIDASQRTGFGGVLPASYSVSGSVPRVAVNGNMIVTGTTQTYMTQVGLPTGDSGGNSTAYVRMGRWNTAQAGWICHLRIYYHAGFNANNAQNGIADVYFKTGNGGSFQSGSSGPFYADGQVFRLGPTALQGFRVVQISPEAYDLYMIIGNFSNGTYYTVDSTNGGWVQDGSASTSAPSGNFLDLTLNSITYT